MRLQTGFRIAYKCLTDVPMLLMLSVHPSRRNDLEAADRLHADPPLDVERYLDGFGNICNRILAPPGLLTLSADFVIRDSGLIDPYTPAAVQHPVARLPPEVLVYLLGSRYCETDLLSDLAWSLFANTRPGWERVQAVCDLVHGHITFDPAAARSSKTARDAWVEGRGVCRDYAHLAVTFCRCLNIPARYCTGYLGDLGVPVTGIMDFSAWFEVYLGDRWHTFDARNNMPRMGRVLIARGRDAVDVPIANTFGPAELVGFEVRSEEAASRTDRGGEPARSGTAMPAGQAMIGVNSVALEQI